MWDVRFGIGHGAWGRGHRVSRQRSEVGSHPSSPYGLRRDKEGKSQRSEVGSQRSEDRCASRFEVGGALRSRLEDIRLRPTGYAATRRSEVRDQRTEEDSRF